MTNPTIAQRLRTMPQPVAIRYAEGLESLFRFNPSLRRLYAPADLAYIDHLARLGEGVSHYAKGFDPNQPRDQKGRWATESTAKLLKTQKRLKAYRNTPLTDADIQNALAVWDHLQHDYGIFAPDRVVELAKQYAKNRKALAVLGWVANRMVG
jgi:hypothetical protein